MSDQSVHPGPAQSAADLELALRAQRLGEDAPDRRQPPSALTDAHGAWWDLELRYSSNEPGGSGADVMSQGRAVFDLEGLDRHLHGGPAATSAYAELLTDGLFADPEVRKAFAVARTAAATAGSPLRVRLLIAPSAYELHRLRWETLLDPERGTPLLMDSNVLFSRYLTSTDWRPVRLRMRSELSALLVIADPSDLAGYQDPSRPSGEGFAPIDVAGEAARARRGLGSMRTVELAEPGQATLTNIVAQLRTGFDVMYLVCHGYIAEDEPQLLLERPDGTTDRVHGRSLIQRLRELQHLPRLVVLASCRSAGHEGVEVARDSGAAAALGPQLIEVGVPAVLAMQGDVSMATIETFIPTFLERLHEHGRIDQATTEARGEIRDRFDWWSPVLFMRLRTGRLWYSAGFGGSGFAKWPALLNDIFEGTCLPLLGPAMTDALLGPRQELARQLADRYHYPLAPYFREDLPQVAQFLAIDQSVNFPVAQLRDHLIDALHQRLLELATSDGEPVPERFLKISRFNRSGGLLDELVTEVWRRLHAGVADPFVLLAQLPLPLYVTTQPASLLEVALEAEGKRPRTEVSRWNEDCPPSVFEADPDYRPSPEEPLIFHIFGHLHSGRSVVIREDDYFEFLGAVSRDRDAIPQVVRRAFVNSALLFLGFRAEDWDFRVLFHSIMQQEGGSRRKAHSHVAAQLDPEASLTSEPEGARRYLESYFRQPHDVSLYWGGVDSFMETLRERLEADLP